MKIGIVNDMPMAVEVLRRAVSQAPEHRVAWIARNGAEAVEQCARETPDLVLMDLLMPVMDGVEATKRIMARTPCAILVVTASVGANAWRTFEAMGHGALDAVDTPTLGGAGAGALLAKIAILGQLVAEKNAPEGSPGRLRTKPPFVSPDQLVAIGASAGGPAALATLLAGLPKDFSAAVVIIQHVDVQFAPGMASWLGQGAKLPVRTARDGDRPVAGQVLLAATNDHLALQASGQLGYTANPREYVYRPSVDVFFASVTRHWPGSAAGVLLTGMGRDGALGLKGLRNQGHHTIAQDQATSAVYGMPRAAATLDAAVEILPLSRIAPALSILFNRKR